MDYVKLAEKEKGRPPFVVEVAQIVKRDSDLANPGLFVKKACFDLFRNDELLGDTELNRVTANPDHQRTEHNETEFELFSDRYQRKWSHLEIGERMRLQPGPNTKVVNWKEHKDLLLSTDLSRASELDWIDAGEIRFLDGESIKG